MSPTWMASLTVGSLLMVPMNAGVFWNCEVSAVWPAGAYADLPYGESPNTASVSGLLAADAVATGTMEEARPTATSVTRPRLSMRPNNVSLFQVRLSGRSSELGHGERDMESMASWR